MAITFAASGFTSGSQAAATSATTASKTWVSGKIYYFHILSYIGSGAPAAPTISQTSTPATVATAIPSATTTYNTASVRSTVFIFKGDGSTDTFKIDFGGTLQTAIQWGIEEATLPWSATGTNGIDCTINVHVATGNSGTAAVSLSAFVDATNDATVMFVSIIGTSAITPNVAYTTLASNFALLGFKDAFLIGSGTSPSATFSSQLWSIIAFEVLFASPAATATSLAGPTHGPNGVASTNFTVGPVGGPFAASTTITPASTNGSDVFTPTSLTLSGSSTGTFTVTPASTGARTISTTNNQSLSNPSSIVYTSENTIPVSDSNLRFVGQWDNGFSGQQVSASSGAQIKAAFTGTTAIAINYVPPVAGNLFCRYTVDEAAWVLVTLTSASSGQLTVATGLGAGTHTLQFQCYSTSLAAVDLWGTGGNAPDGALRVTGFVLDSGGTTVALSGTAIALRSTTLWADGDSITRGAYADGASTEAASNAMHGYAVYVALGLQCEFVCNGNASQGWQTPVVGENIPAYEDAWNKYNNAHNRSFASPPTYYLVNEGTNGGNPSPLATSGSTGVIRGVMAAQRAACGVNTKIIYIIPFGQFAATGILNDLSYYGGGTTSSNGYTSITVGTTTIYTAVGDANFWVIDLGAAEGVMGANRAIGGHPLAEEAGRKGALIVQAVRAKESMVSLIFTSPGLTPT